MKENFHGNFMKGNHDCDQCQKKGIYEKDTQRHILECATILSENGSANGQYNEIFCNNIYKQVCIARSILTNLNIRQNL